MSVETASPPLMTVQAAPVDTRMASLRAIYIIWYRDILRYWRDRWRLVASLAQPLLFVLAPFVGVKLSLLTVVELVPLAAVLAFGLASFGVAIASMMKSLQGFQVVMNFLMMPMFFLSGALFPLTNLPGWMTWLTRLDPASYGIDPIRRVVLSNSGLPNVNSLGLTINGQVLAIPMEAAIMLAFGAVLLGVAVVMFERRD